jgi:hypothetical protein
MAVIALANDTAAEAPARETWFIALLGMVLS